MRAALEEARPQLSGNLAGFPTECCNHASMLLAMYFYDCGINMDGFVWGGAKLSKAPVVEHIWLEKGELVIDITADQFNGSRASGLRPVIVSRTSAWHAVLPRESRAPGWVNEGKAAYFTRQSKEFYGPVYATLRPILERLSA
jgi:hypothetical protein